MAFSTSANDTTNIRMGTCVVIYDGNVLGFTKGGVELDLSTSTKEIKVDQFGDTPVAEYIMGRTLMAKCPMAETSIKLIADTMGGTARFTGGADGEKVEIRSGTGVSLLAEAKTLILRPVVLHDASAADPVNEASHDRSEDFIIHKAAAPGALQFAYKYDEERVFNLEFKGYPDSANSGLMATYGDPSAVTPA